MNSVVEDNTALMPGSVREISGVVKNFFFARIFLTCLPHTCLLVIMTKPLCGAFLNVPLQEKLSLRTLIDHSIVESFGGEGKACITARVYPTNLAVDGATHLYFFNNGSQSIHISKFTAWTMKSAQIN
ncbi:hypothetical protein T459_08212 [Capsicum annuum]|uniref:Glycosyl hydrolase family 32 C-terminal domain-containing protein n=1 Tax=Capsicum annuum TaxID=4072 RepID=A0A2G2ZVX7_CAPAN|nr:hypothetical protein T459_08212 [Capsicum annuum]